MQCYDSWNMSYYLSHRFPGTGWRPEGISLGKHSSVIQSLGGGTGCVHHPPSIYFSLSVLWLCSVLSVCLTVSFSDSETHRLSYDCCVSLSKTVLSTGKAEQEAWKNWENECDGSLLCSSLSHAHVKDVVTFIFDTWKVLSFLGVYSYGIIHLLIFYLLSLSAITSIPFHIRVVCYQRPL